MPAATKVTSGPLTVHTLVVVDEKATGRRELAVATRLSEPGRY